MNTHTHQLKDLVPSLWSPAGEAERHWDVSCAYSIDILNASDAGSLGGLNEVNDLLRELPAKNQQYHGPPGPV